ncbi:MAG: zinc-binding dehydrogenase [Candidatus Caenarcaniphilales bacterium]|nr:zinc-binding dehydrogenase [Candidatus Caenarcaniphilales bacterium]
MKSILFYGPEDIRYEEIAKPEPKNGEVLVKIIYAATGGTDLKTYLRGHPRIIKEIPSRFGYELIGEIEEIGMDVEGFRRGDIVVPANTAPCFKCFFCKKEEYSLCKNLEFLNGSFSEYIIIPAKIVKHNLYKVEERQDLDSLCMTQTLAVALHGFERSKIKDKDVVVIYGLGAIGQCFIKLCKAFRDCEVIALGRSEHKLKLAQENGADKSINISGLNGKEIEQTLKKEHKYGADVVIEAVGKEEAWQNCINLVRAGGLINYFGGCTKGSSINLDTYRVHYEEIKIIGVFHHSPYFIQKAFELIASKQIDMKNLISEELRLKDLKVALEKHRQGQVFKILIKV